MPKVAQKFTDIIVLGSGTYIDTLLNILSYQSKKTFRHYNPKECRFVNNNTLVVDGEKISAKKFLFVRKKTMKQRSFIDSTVRIERADLVDYSTIDATVKICVVGSDQSAITEALACQAHGAHVTLLSEEAAILTNYDSSVQDVVERMLKKQGISLVKNCSLLSLHEDNGVTTIISSIDGTPHTTHAHRIIAAPVATYKEDIGIDNLSDPTALFSSDTPYTKIGRNIILLNDSEHLGLRTLYDVVGDVVGKPKRRATKERSRALFDSPELSYFSIGTLEQDHFDTHLGYKKSIAKVNVPGVTHGRWFIKVVTTTHNRVIGIHGVLPFSYQNIDLLIYLVENKSHISELRNSCLADDILVGAYVQIIGDLS